MYRFSYEEVIHIIENTRRFGNMTGVEVSQQMLQQLGHPEQGLPFIHIAGTNGKGSTTAFLCNILEQTGKKIGMFTSPHLIHFEERIRINGEYIPKEDVTRLGNLLLEMNFEVSPTMFDYCLAMAVLYFKEQSCDIIVMETGIGGRCDSTNALGVPEAAVITKIGYDHMAVLGNTIEEIAREKAGIIKKGCPVIVSSQDREIIEVIRRYFCQVNKLELSDNLYITSKKDIAFIEKIPMKMVGAYQIENAALAALTANVLLRKWLKEERDSQIREYICAGIKKTVWKGRMEIINQNPFFMIDGAHNSHGVKALANSLKQLYPGEKFHFIMGVMADKDYEEMIEELLPLALDFITVTPENKRALQSEDLAKCIEEKGVKASYAQDMKSVILPLLQKTEKGLEMESKTIAFGSLYFIGAIEAMCEENGR